MEPCSHWRAALDRTGIHCAHRHQLNARLCNFNPRSLPSRTICQELGARTRGPRNGNRCLNPIMPVIYCARWVLPIISPALADGAVAIDNSNIVAVGPRAAVVSQFPDSRVEDFGEAA